MKLRKTHTRAVVLSLVVSRVPRLYAKDNALLSRTHPSKINSKVHFGFSTDSAPLKLSSSSFCFVGQLSENH